MSGSMVERVRGAHSISIQRLPLNAKKEARYDPGTLLDCFL